MFNELRWPNLSDLQWIAILCVNIGSFIFAYILLRFIWPPPSEEDLRQAKILTKSINEITQKHYHSLDVNDSIDEDNDSSQHSLNNSNQNGLLVPQKSPIPTESSSLTPNSASSSTSRNNNTNKRSKVRKEAIECLEGESAGDYSQPWTQTFDLTFVIIMTLAGLILAIWTTLESPSLWTNPYFWASQIPKIATMMLVSYIGGLLCRYFCQHDELGYIITNKASVFKVNYTRKLQHFAAYLVPLLMHSKAAGTNVSPALTLAWGNWVTLLGFLILIKPIRERSTFVMLQFNALDRPEDRPSTLSWIVGGNIIPGCILIVFFRWLYSQTDQSDLAYIFIFITGVGDGLAEPVGIYLGKHKYWTKSLFGDRKYQRSWEGSACVFISSVIFTSLFYYSFLNATQFWASMLVLPPLMAYAEATSPHTLDTPFLMGLGGLALWIISHLEIEWV